MARHKLVGEVIALTGAFTGTYIVKAYRYPSGRLLPETRIIVEEGRPFSSRLKALDVLNAYTDGDVVVGRARLAVLPQLPSAALPAPVTQLSAPHIEPNHALDHEGEKRIKRLRTRREIEAQRKARAPLPEIIKIPEPSLAPARVDAYVGFRITRCPDGARQGDSKWGGPKGSAIGGNIW